ncbi:hypothetical protein ACKE5C_18970 (plasmid) [Aneurinibacillus thermoaerophilus]|uniref:DUF4352 domain-containing protein n=1 Tax=Aneurinibacillus thermoaerophilus TaxID=143495 RepID=A0ABX8YH22_ANETH|nr:hypothetical protein [Aneurinibacillus thermoaerophilus]QYY44720.1 hypothetical protein K3F53_18930 [Aneurinibacillus thermoaerophilus]
MKNRRALLLGGLAVLSIVFTACGETKQEQVSMPQQTQQPTTPLTAQEFQQAFSDPTPFKGRQVEYYGKVFTDVERNADGTFIQAWADPKNSTGNTIISYGDPNLDVKNGDLIHVIGTIRDKFTGQNAFGAEIVAPLIDATSIEKATYTDLYPAIKTIEVNQEQNHKGFVVKVHKVEIAEQETRVYVSVENKRKNDISLFTHKTRIIEGERQLDVEDNFEANYPKLQSDIAPGVTSEGVLVFKPMAPDISSFKLQFEGMSSDFVTQIAPFEFTITQK